MIKFVIIILACIVCCSAQVFTLWNLIGRIGDSQDTNIVRVRTAREMLARSDEQAVLDFIGLVEQYEGYTAEEYQVKTSDGYILKLHRVNGSPLSPAAYGKPVVFIGIGLFVSSDYFAVLGPQKSILYLLADAGYDVWIGNFRGSTYSRRHVQYSAKGDNLKFWNFSMDELGLIDLPLFIDTVLQKTNKSKLAYAGFSMGTTLSAILLSTKPEYNQKMQVVVGVAPVILFSRPYSSFASTLLALATPAKALASAARMYQVLPQSKINQVIGEDVCLSGSGRLFCEGFLSNIVRVERMNKTVIPTLFKYYPAGASLFAVDHFVQFARTEKFGRYDHGAAINKIKYGSPVPPLYDLTKVTAPQALIYSDSDVFSNARDVERLSRIFPNVVALIKVRGFNHADYGWLDESKEAVDKPLMRIINAFSKV